MAMAQDMQAGQWRQAPDRDHVVEPVIVVGLDGSPSSWDAFCWAAGEAVRINGKVVAVHVVPLTEGSPRSMCHMLMPAPSRPDKKSPTR
jgi:hypothetical protein